MEPWLKRFTIYLVVFLGLLLLVSAVTAAPCMTEERLRNMIAKDTKITYETKVMSGEAMAEFRRTYNKLGNRHNKTTGVTYFHGGGDKILFVSPKRGSQMFYHMFKNSW